MLTERALIKCREPGRHSTLDKGHEEGGSAYANAGSSLRSPVDAVSVNSVFTEVEQIILIFV